MRPIGKRYLLKMFPDDNVVKKGDIFVVNDIDKMHDIFYKAEVVSYGTGFKDDDPDLIPLGSKVVVDYKHKNGTKIQVLNNLYQIKDPDFILGVYEDEE